MQVIARACVIVLLCPCIIWPCILDSPYQWITKAGARMMARAIIGKKGARVKAETVSG